MRLIRVGVLPDEPLSAAAHFHAAVLPSFEPGGAAALLLVFAPADHTHRGWRLAAVQSLARQWAPCRVNAVAADDEAAITAAARYLALAEGVTGQYLRLDSQGAGGMLSSSG